MIIYEYDVVSILLVAFGLFACCKRSLQLNLKVGKSNFRTSVEQDESSEYKQIQLNTVTTKIIGLLLILGGIVLYLNLKGEILFSI
jgi:hypothetical protein